MKTLHYSIIIFSIAGLLVGMSNSVYAPCLVGVIDCGPPTSVKVSIGADSQFYEKNDTINIQGQVYVQNYSKPIHIQVVNSNNATIQSADTSVINGKFGLKIRANFDTTGDYHIATCVQGWCDGWFFKFIAEPYKLTVNGQDFFIKYKSFADLVGMEADINSQALRVHIVNATSQGEQFVIELPRALIDSKGYDGKDASFRVFLGMHQPDKYMQPANFTEIASNDVSRKLAINIPYEPVPNSSGMWDFKIMSANTVSGPSVFSEPPLKQFKLGMRAMDIKCKEGLQLVIKSEDGSPACVKPDTAYRLILKSWAKEFIQSVQATSSDLCGGIEVPSGNLRTGMVPVLMMKPNSTATVCVTYQFISDWNSYPNKDIYPHGIFETCCLVHMGKSSTVTSSNQFEVLANPPLFNVTGVYNESKITVVYKIHAGLDSSGFYDSSIPYGNCNSYPLAVGYDSSQVDASDFSYNMDIPCFNTIDKVDSVKIVSGMSYKQVTFR